MLYSRSLLVIYFIYSSVYTLIPNSWFIPPLPPSPQFWTLGLASCTQSYYVCDVHSNSYVCWIAFISMTVYHSLAWKTTVCESFLLLMGLWVVSRFCLFWQCCVPLLAPMSTRIFPQNPRVELLGHRVCRCLAVEDTVRQFCTNFHSHLQCLLWVLLAPHPRQHWIWPDFANTSHPGIRACVWISSWL